MAVRKKRARGRPKLPSGEARQEVLQIRLSVSEKKAIQGAAKAAGEPISGWARAVLLREAGLG